MKSISKKIKSIYLLAMMAILSVCVAVFPVFKTETVNAEGESNFYVAGAYLKVDKDLEKENPATAADNFALMFKAEFTKTLYYGSDGVPAGDENNTVQGLDEQIVKFGMAIGLKDSLSSVTTYQQIVDQGENVHIFDALVGSGIQGVELKEGETTFEYEAGVFYNKNQTMIDPDTEEEVPMYPAGTDWSKIYGTELIAIPFYTIFEGDGETVKQVVLGDNQSPASITAGKTAYKSAKSVALDEMLLESNTPIDSKKRAVSDKVFTQITGMEVQSLFANRGYPNQEAYYDKGSKRFFYDFEIGSNTFNDTQDILCNGSLYEPATTAKKFAWATPANTYFAGQQVKAFGTTNHTLTLSDSVISNSGVMDNFEDGKTYRIYNIKNGVLYYVDYIVCTQLFTGLSGSSMRGQNLTQSVTVNGGSNKRTYFSYSYDMGKDEYYMPTSHKFEDDKNYDGYYVLAADLIVPAPNAGSKITYRSGKTLIPFLSTAATADQMIGALKHLKLRDSADFDKTKDAAFTGTFDGRGNTIQTAFNRGGLFGFINGGTVKNLNIEADFFEYTATSTAVSYSNESYQKNSATLAEVIHDATIENVSIKVKSSPITFKGQKTSETGNTITKNKPNYYNVAGVVAASGIYTSTLNNVIVNCDTLKDVGDSIQNYRAALNIDSASTLNNVFVIGSSYSNMSISNDYTLTLSLPQAPAGYAFGTSYLLSEHADLNAKYGPMITDMYTWMRNEDVSGKALKIKFVEEKAKHFIDEDAFQAYIMNSDNVEAKNALVNSGMWKEDSNKLVLTIKRTWETVSNTKTPPTIVYGDADFSYTPNENGGITAETEVSGDGTNDATDPFVDYFGWSVVNPSLTKYEVRVVLAGSDTLVTLPQA